MIDGRFEVIGAAGPRALFEHLTGATLSHGYLFTGPQGVGAPGHDVRRLGGVRGADRRAGSGTDPTAG